MLKALFLLLSISLFGTQARSSDFGDHNHAIYVTEAENVITGCCGNFLSAKVAVSKDVIGRHFKSYEIRISGYENIEPTAVEDHEDYLVFLFDRYAKGIEYHGNSASVVAYITNGIDRLYDNNEPVFLRRENNWRYKSTFDGF